MWSQQCKTLHKICKGHRTACSAVIWSQVIKMSKKLILRLETVMSSRNFIRRLRTIVAGRIVFPQVNTCYVEITVLVEWKCNLNTMNIHFLLVSCYISNFKHRSAFNKFLVVLMQYVPMKYWNVDKEILAGNLLHKSFVNMGPFSKATCENAFLYLNSIKHSGNI